MGRVARTRSEQGGSGRHVRELPVASRACGSPADLAAAPGDAKVKETSGRTSRADTMSARNEAAETPGTTIVLVLETNPEYWRVAGDLDVALRQVLIFVNAHLSLSKRNRVVLIAMHADGKCHYLYEPTEGVDAPKDAETLDPIQSDVGKKALAKLAAFPAAAINETSARKKI